MIAASLLLAQAATASAGAGLPADARLDRLVAFEARIEPLPEVLARLGGEIGAKLTVERKMSTLKATVLVAARPGRRTMADLASVFDSEWIPVEGGYRLEMSVPKRNLSERYLAAERAERRAATEIKWRQAAALAEARWDQIAALRDEAMAAVSGFRSNLDPGFPEASGRYQALDEMARTGHRYVIGRLARSFGERDWASLWEGRSFYGSSVATGGVPALPKDSAKIISPVMSFEEGEALPAVRAFFRFDLDSGDAGWVVLWNGGGSRATPGTGWGGEATEATLRHPFRKAQEAWATDPQTTQTRELDLPLKRLEGQEALALKTRWEGPWANDSDLLESLHRQSGLNVVAEATRRASRRRPGLFTEETVRAALDAWDFHGAARLEGGALLYRPHSFWNRRATEPSESAMRRWERRPDRGVDALAELVSAVTPAQARMLPAMTSRKRLERIDSGLSGLRVWGRLTASERARAHGAEGLSFAEMNPAAREAAITAMVDGVFEGATPSGRTLALFDAPWDPSRLGAISLFAVTQDVETGSVWLDGPTGGDEKLSKLEPVPGVRLEFGPTRGEGLGFTVPR